MREYDGKRMLGLFNFSAEHCQSTALSGEQIEPYGFRWIFLKED